MQSKKKKKKNTALKYTKKGVGGNEVIPPPELGSDLVAQCGILDAVFHCVACCAKPVLQLQIAKHSRVTRRLRQNPDNYWFMNLLPTTGWSYSFLTKKREWSVSDWVLYSSFRSIPSYPPPLCPKSGWKFYIFKENGDKSVINCSQIAKTKQHAWQLDLCDGYKTGADDENSTFSVTIQFTLL